MSSLTASKLLLLYTYMKVAKPARKPRDNSQTPRSRHWVSSIALSPAHEPDFKQTFRVSQATFNLLLHGVRPLLNPRDRIPAEVKLACFLNFVGHPKSALDAGEKFGIGEETVRALIPVIAKAIIEAFADEITFPRVGTDEWNRLKEGFAALGSLPGAVGALDSSHIFLKGKPGVLEYPEHYTNRKGLYSVHLQAVVAVDMQFLSVSIGRPGRMHARLARSAALLALPAADLV